MNHAECGPSSRPSDRNARSRPAGAFHDLGANRPGLLARRGGQLAEPDPEWTLARRPDLTQHIRESMSALLFEIPMSIALALAAVSLSTPIPTPPIFVAGDYALTFRAPPNTTTCPFPADWVGSNHGTVVFLRPPKGCGGVGYPSSSRSFSENVPRIEVFHAYWIGDPGTGPKPCRRVLARSSSWPRRVRPKPRSVARLRRAGVAELDPPAVT